MLLCCYLTVLRCPACVIIWYSVIGHEKQFFYTYASLILKVLKKLCLNNVHFLSVQVGGSKTGFFKPSFVSWLLCMCPDLFFANASWIWVHLLIYVQCVKVCDSCCTSSFAHSQQVHSEGFIFYFFLLLDMEILFKKVVKCPGIFSTGWLEFFTTSLVSSRFHIKIFLL